MPLLSVAALFGLSTAIAVLVLFAVSPSQERKKNMLGAECVGGGRAPDGRSQK